MTVKLLRVRHKSDTENYTMDETSNATEESQTTLPISRVRTIMKSSPDVSNIGQDALLVMTKATEFFVAYLAQRAFHKRTKSKEVDYRDLANFIQEDEDVEFLHEIIPHKVKVRDLNLIMANNERSAKS